MAKTRPFIPVWVTSMDTLTKLFCVACTDPSWALQSSRRRGVPMEARSVLTTLQFQAWANDGVIPSDPVRLQTISDSTEDEWARSWPLIKRFWVNDGEMLRSVLPLPAVPFPFHLFSLLRPT